MLRGVRLTSRRLLRLTGADTLSFLQGLVTRDLVPLQPCQVSYAFLLNSKGRILHELLIYKRSEAEFLLDVDASSSAQLERLLKLYRLRRKIDIATTSEPVNFLLTPASGSVEDPRVPGFGYRHFGDVQFSERLTEEDYLDRRLEWGIPEGSEELGNQIPLNMNGDLMNGISFEKGCYIGQELVARTHHTGVVRRRVLPFTCSKAVQGDVLDEKGKKCGKVLRSTDSRGLALIPPNHAGSKLMANGSPISVFLPSWWPSSEVQSPT